MNKINHILTDLLNTISELNASPAPGPADVPADKDDDDTNKVKNRYFLVNKIIILGNSLYKYAHSFFGEDF